MQFPYSEVAMTFTKRMLLQNVAWAKEASGRDPQLFERLRHGQSPSVLWIGCADSRVPAEVLTGTQPGELFVHRNIANLSLPYDHNTMSVVEYAVRVLNVADIVVCGHYGCGGVRAALDTPHQHLPYVEHHISVLRWLARRHRAELDALATLDERANRLSELNVLEQVRTLRTMPVIRDAQHALKLHPWVFDVREGLIKTLPMPAQDEVLPVVASPLGWSEFSQPVAATA